MKLRDIVAQAREWLDDEVGGDGPDETPYLWPTKSLLRYGTEAQLEACFRARLLIESTRPEVCRVDLVEGQTTYGLHPSIIVVRRAEYTPATEGMLGCLLTRSTFDLLDRTDLHWQTKRGRPDTIVHDLQARSLRINRIPTADTLGHLQLTVWRKPLEAEAIERGSDEPVIPEEWHLPLAHWICYRAFLRKDSQTFDEKRAELHLGQFEATFGPRPTVEQLRALATDMAGEVECHWF